MLIDIKQELLELQVGQLIITEADGFYSNYLSGTNEFKEIGLLDLGILVWFEVEENIEKTIEGFGEKIVDVIDVKELKISKRNK